METNYVLGKRLKKRANPAFERDSPEAGEPLNFTLGVSMKRSLIFLLSFCLAVFLASFYVAAFKDSTVAYSLSVVSFACFVALYSVGLLGYKIGGNYIQLETKVETLEKQNTELKQSVTALLKSIYVMSDVAGRWDGTSEKHHKLLSEYLAPIAHLIASNAKEQVASDIAKLFPPENP